MNRLHITIRIIAAILVASMCLQDVVWANPDCVKDLSSQTLQIPSFLAHNHEAKLYTELSFIADSIVNPYIRTFNHQIRYDIDGAMHVMNFRREAKNGSICAKVVPSEGAQPEHLVVPCWIIPRGEDPLQYEASINLANPLDVSLKRLKDGRVIFDGSNAPQAPAGSDATTGWWDEFIPAYIKGILKNRLQGIGHWDRGKPLNPWQHTARMCSSLDFTGLSDKNQTLLKIAAALHDIGKVVTGPTISSPDMMIRVTSHEGVESPDNAKVILDKIGASGDETREVLKVLTTGKASEHSKISAILAPRILKEMDIKEERDLKTIIFLIRRHSLLSSLSKSIKDIVEKKEGMPEEEFREKIEEALNFVIKILAEDDAGTSINDKIELLYRINRADMLSIPWLKLAVSNIDFVYKLLQIKITNGHIPSDLLRMLALKIAVKYFDDIKCESPMQAMTPSPSAISNAFGPASHDLLPPDPEFAPRILIQTGSIDERKEFRAFNIVTDKFEDDIRWAEWSERILTNKTVVRMMAQSQGSKAADGLEGPDGRYEAYLSNQRVIVKGLKTGEFVDIGEACGIEFKNPSAVSFRRWTAYFIYVCDTGNNRVARISYEYTLSFGEQSGTPSESRLVPSPNPIPDPPPEEPQASLDPARGRPAAPESHRGGEKDAQGGTGANMAKTGDAAQSTGETGPSSQESSISDGSLTQLLSKKIRVRDEWMLLLRALAAKVPKGQEPTPTNVALQSGGVLTPRMIYTAFYTHKISYNEVNVVSKKRTRREWVDLLRSLVAKLQVDKEATSANVAAVSNGMLTARQIRSEMPRHSIGHREVNMVREISEPRTRKEWVSMIKKAVARVPAGMPLTPRNVADASGGTLERDQVYHAFERYGITYDEVGMTKAIADFRTREEWIDLLSSLVGKLPAGMEPTVGNLAAISGRHKLEPADIYQALSFHDISYEQVGLKKMPRNRDEWMEYLRQLAAKVPEEVARTCANVAAASDGDLSEHNIGSLMSYHDIDYSQVGMVIERASPRSRQEWLVYLKSLVAKVPKRERPTPNNVAAVSDGKMTAGKIRSALHHHKISYETVEIVREQPNISPEGIKMLERLGLPPGSGVPYHQLLGFIRDLEAKARAVGHPDPSQATSEQVEVLKKRDRRIRALRGERMTQLESFAEMAGVPKSLPEEDIVAAREELLRRAIAAGMPRPYTATISEVEAAEMEKSASAGSDESGGTLQVHAAPSASATRKEQHGAVTNKSADRPAAPESHRGGGEDAPGGAGAHMAKPGDEAQAPVDRVPEGIGRNDAESEKIEHSLEIIRNLKGETKMVFIVPMYNELERLKPAGPDNSLGEDALRKKVVQIVMLKKANPAFKVRLIFVDDGSEDAACAKCVESLWKDIIKEYRREGIELEDDMVTAIAMSPEDKELLKSRKGGAVHMGFEKAITDGWADYIGYTDTDNSTNIAQAGLLMKGLLKDGVGAAIGSRRCEGGCEFDVKKSGRASSVFFNWYVRLMLPPLRGIKDTQRGFKLFKRELVEKFVSEAHDKGWSFDIELLLLTKFNGYDIQETGIAWFDSSEASTFDALKSAPKAFWQITRLGFKELWKSAIRGLKRIKAGKIWKNRSIISLALGSMAALSVILYLALPDCGWKSYVSLAVLIPLGAIWAEAIKLKDEKIVKLRYKHFDKVRIAVVVVLAFSVFAWLWPLTYTWWKPLPDISIGIADQLFTGPISISLVFFFTDFFHKLIESGSGWSARGMGALAKRSVKEQLTNYRFMLIVAFIFWVPALGTVFSIGLQEHARNIIIGGILLPIFSLLNFYKAFKKADADKMVRLKWWARILVPAVIVYNFIIFPNFINVPALLFGAALYLTLLLFGFERAGSDPSRLPQTPASAVKEKLPEGAEPPSKPGLEIEEPPEGTGAHMAKPGGAPKPPARVPLGRKQAGAKRDILPHTVRLDDAALAILRQLDFGDMRLRDRILNSKKLPLDELERAILLDKYFTAPGKAPLSLSDIGKRFKVGREMARQAEAELLKKIVYFYQYLSSDIDRGRLDQEPVWKLAYFPTRVRNALEKLGIKTIADLCAKETDDFMELRSFGETSLQEINRALEANNIEKRFNLPERRRPGKREAGAGEGRTKDKPEPRDRKVVSRPVHVAAGQEAATSRGKMASKETPVITPEIEAPSAVPLSVASVLRQAAEIARERGPDLADAETLENRRVLKAMDYIDELKKIIADERIKIEGSETPPTPETANRLCAQLFAWVDSVIAEMNRQFDRKEDEEVIPRYKRNMRKIIREFIAEIKEFIRTGKYPLKETVMTGPADERVHKKTITPGAKGADKPLEPITELKQLRPKEGKKVSVRHPVYGTGTVTKVERGKGQLVNTEITIRFPGRGEETFHFGNIREGGFIELFIEKSNKPHRRGGGKDTPQGGTGAHMTKAGDGGAFEVRDTVILQKVLVRSGFNKTWVDKLTEGELAHIAGIIRGPDSRNEKARKLLDLLPTGAMGFDAVRVAAKKAEDELLKLGSGLSKKVTVDLAAGVELPQKLMEKIARVLNVDFKNLIMGIDYDSTEGRSVYINTERVLGTPLAICGKIIKVIKIKGVCFDADKELRPIEGLFPLVSIFGPKGEVVDQYTPTKKPFGAMTMDTVDTEYSITEAAYRGGVNVAIPIGKVSFDNVQYQGQQLGAVILGMEHDDEKDSRSILADMVGRGEYNYKTVTFNFVMDPEKIVSDRARVLAYLRNIGRSYRQLHDLHIIQYMVHFGNIVARPDGMVRISDFEYGTILKDPTVPQEISYRVNDIRNFFTAFITQLNPKLIADLRRNYEIELAREFLAGYMGRDVNRSAFIYTTEGELNDLLVGIHQSSEIDRHMDLIKRDPFLSKVRVIVEENNRRIAAGEQQGVVFEEARIPDPKFIHRKVTEEVTRDGFLKIGEVGMIRYRLMIEDLLNNNPDFIRNTLTRLGVEGDLKRFTEFKSAEIFFLGWGMETRVYRVVLRSETGEEAKFVISIGQRSCETEKAMSARTKTGEYVYTVRNEFKELHEMHSALPDNVIEPCVYAEIVKDALSHFPVFSARFYAGYEGTDVVYSDGKYRIVDIATADPTWQMEGEDCLKYLKDTFKIQINLFLRLGKLYDVSAGNSNFMYPVPKNAPSQGHYMLGERMLNTIGYDPAIPIILTSARQGFIEKDGRACLVWSLFEAKQVMNVKARGPQDVRIPLDRKDAISILSGALKDIYPGRGREETINWLRSYVNMFETDPNEPHERVVFVKSVIADLVNDAPASEFHFRGGKDAPPAGTGANMAKAGDEAQGTAESRAAPNSMATNISYSLYSQLLKDQKTAALAALIADFHKAFKIGVPEDPRDVIRKFNMEWRGRSRARDYHDAIVVFSGGRPIALLGFGVRKHDGIGWDEGVFVIEGERLNGLGIGLFETLFGLLKERGVGTFHIGNPKFPSSGPILKTKQAQALSESIIKKYKNAVIDIKRTPKGKISRIALDLSLVKPMSQAAAGEPPAGSAAKKETFAVKRKELKEAGFRIIDLKRNGMTLDGCCRALMSILRGYPYACEDYAGDLGHVIENIYKRGYFPAIVALRIVNDKDRQYLEAVVLDSGEGFADVDGDGRPDIGKAVKWHLISYDGKGRRGRALYYVVENFDYVRITSNGWRWEKGKRGVKPVSAMRGTEIVFRKYFKTKDSGATRSEAPHGGAHMAKAGDRLQGEAGDRLPMQPAPVASTVHFDYAASLEESVPTGPAPFMREDLADPKEAAENFVEAILSRHITKRVVLALESGLGGAHRAKLMEFFAELERLKKSEKYGKLLSNLEIIKNHTAENLPVELSEYLEKPEKNAVFVFARAKDEIRYALRNIESKATTTYIEEDPCYGNPTAYYYYPLVEIITATIARHMDIASLDEIKVALKKVDVEVRLDSLSDSILIFTLLPSAKKFNSDSLKDHYAMLIEALRQA